MRRRDAQLHPGVGGEEREGDAPVPGHGAEVARERRRSRAERGVHQRRVEVRAGRGRDRFLRRGDRDHLEQLLPSEVLDLRARGGVAIEDQDAGPAVRRLRWI